MKPGIAVVLVLGIGLGACGKKPETRTKCVDGFLYRKYGDDPIWHAQQVGDLYLKCWVDTNPKP